MVDWELRARQVVDEPRKRPVLIWTPYVLVEAMGLPYTPRNRRHARAALEAMWKEGVLVRRAEMHGVRATPTSAYRHEVAYAHPQLVAKSKTTAGEPYAPEDGRSMVGESEA